MREFLDEILAFIGSESLTDEEFESLGLPDEIPDPIEYTTAQYLALRAVLESRENVSGQVKRLKQYFLARGVDLGSTPAVPTPRSNIYIGGAL